MAGKLETCITGSYTPYCLRLNHETETWFEVDYISPISRTCSSNSFIQGFTHLYINLACLGVWVFVCLFVCLYPINVKTAEPIGPKFFVGHHVIPGKVYG